MIQLFRSHAYPLIFIFFLLILPTQLGMTWKKPWKADEISYSLKRKDGHYVLEAKLRVDSDPGCLLQVIFSSYHIQKLMAKEADRVEILHETPEYYELRSVHHNKLCSLDTVYSRRLSEIDGRITFELIQCTQESKVAPKLVSSKGYYEIQPDSGGAILRYYEETRLEANRWDPRAMALVKIVERDTVLFLKKIKKYSETSACRHAPEK
jgi:hypothetical protein